MSLSYYWNKATQEFLINKLKKEQFSDVGLKAVRQNCDQDLQMLHSKHPLVIVKETGNIP